MSDPVNSPKHYQRGGIETIDVIEAWELSYCLGNTVKYISRAGLKGDALEDLKKARWYLNREIEAREDALAKAEKAEKAQLVGSWDWMSERWAK